MRGRAMPQNYKDGSASLAGARPAPAGYGADTFAPGWAYKLLSSARQLPLALLRSRQPITHVLALRGSLADCFQLLCEFHLG